MTDMFPPDMIRYDVAKPNHGDLQRAQLQTTAELCEGACWLKLGSLQIPMIGLSNIIPAHVRREHVSESFFVEGLCGQRTIGQDGSTEGCGGVGMLRPASWKAERRYRLETKPNWREQKVAELEQGYFWACLLRRGNITWQGQWPQDPDDRKCPPISEALYWIFNTFIPWIRSSAYFLSHIMLSTSCWSFFQDAALGSQRPWLDSQPPGPCCRLRPGLLELPPPPNCPKTEKRVPGRCTYAKRESQVRNRLGFS